MLDYTSMMAYNANLNKMSNNSTLATATLLNRLLTITGPGLLAEVTS